MDELLKSCFEFARDAILANAMTIEREAEIISETFDISVPFARHHLQQLCETKVLKADDIKEFCRPKSNYWFPDCHRDGLD
jgi:hypothetical protein